jgi:peptidylprolyl isomerase
MKLSPFPSRYGFLFLGIFFVTLGSSLHSQTNVPPATNAPAAAGGDQDKDSEKPIVTTPSGLKYVDLVVGTGPVVKPGDHVVVKYLGTLPDGTKFDSSADHPGGTYSYIQNVTSQLSGWTEGTSTMKVGGKRKLIIPPQLGYGQRGQGDVIPPNATLIYEIEIVSATAK